MLRNIDAMNEVLDTTDGERFYNTIDKLKNKIEKNTGGSDENEIFDFLEKTQLGKFDPFFVGYLELVPLLTGLSDYKESNFTVENFIHDVIALSLQTKKSIEQLLKEGILPPQIVRGKKTPLKEKNKEFYLEILKMNPSFVNESFLGYLRLLGILPPKDYNKIHEGALYNFTKNETPSKFAEFLTTRSNGSRVLKGNICDLGSGNGRDSIYFLENDNEEFIKSITLVDTSPSALSNAQILKQKKLDENQQKKLIIPDTPQDIKNFLKQLSEDIQSGKREPIDLFYSLSSHHYFDTPTLEEILRLEKQCLSPSGKIVFSIKGLDSLFDGFGIPIIDSSTILPDPNNKSEEGTKRVYKRCTYVPDGIIRYTRDMIKWKEILKKQCGFNILEVYEGQDTVNEEDYEFPGQGKEKFFRFILEAENDPIGDED